VRDLIAIGALSLLCSVWVLLQRWIERRDPGNPGVARECDGGCGRCTADCQRLHHA